MVQFPRIHIFAVFFLQICIVDFLTFDKHLIHMYIYIYKCMYMYVCIYVHIYQYVYVNILMYVCLCMYIQ